MTRRNATAIHLRSASGRFEWWGTGVCLRMADPLATSRPGRWRVARLVGQIRARWPRVKIVLRADSASRESEDHQLRRLLRECSLGPDSAVADRCEHGLDRVGGAQVIPMLGREVEEGQQRLAV
jgi:hypothetical protein